THNNAPEENVQWSPDGRTVSYLAPSDTAWDLAEQKIWLVPASGGTPTRLLNGFNGAIRQYTGAPDGRSIVFAAQTRARGAAYRIAVPSGAIAKITSGDWSGAMESVSADASRGVAIVSAPAQPAEVTLIDLASGKLTPVTHTNPRVSDFALAQFRA